MTRAGTVMALRAASSTHKPLWLTVSAPRAMGSCAASIRFIISHCSGGGFGSGALIRGLPRGLKPLILQNLDAALKRRSTVVLQGGECSGWRTVQALFGLSGVAQRHSLSGERRGQRTLHRSTEVLRHPKAEASTLSKSDTLSLSNTEASSLQETLRRRTRVSAPQG